MIIPYQQIAADTLELIEHYVLREGTDYGDVEVSTEQKVAEVKAQLKSGEALIVFSELHESVNIVSKAQFKPCKARSNTRNIERCDINRKQLCTWRDLLQSKLNNYKGKVFL